MALRAWRVWGMSAVLASGVVALAQSPKSEVSGRATPTITQDHYQAESAPPPRVLPQQVREENPSKTAPPTAGQFNANVLGLQIPVTAIDPDVPSWVIHSTWKAQTAFEIAEAHFDDCDLAEARKWYEEVIKLAPKSEYAATALLRLEWMQVLPAGDETREPPLADLGAVGPAIPIP